MKIESAERTGFVKCLDFLSYSMDVAVHSEAPGLTPVPVSRRVPIHWFETSSAPNWVTTRHLGDAPQSRNEVLVGSVLPVMGIPKGTQLWYRRVYQWNYVSLCEFGVVASQKKGLYVSVSFMGAMRESMKIRIYPWHGVGHAISWWLLESMRNFDEPSHEQTTSTVESVCSSIRMLRHLPPLIKTPKIVCRTPLSGRFFFNGNFKDQNNSCVHKGHQRP